MTTRFLTASIVISFCSFSALACSSDSSGSTDGSGGALNGTGGALSGSGGSTSGSGGSVVGNGGSSGATGTGAAPGSGGASGGAGGGAAAGGSGNVNGVDGGLDGALPVDGGQDSGPVDAGPPHTGACCSAHASKGCSNPTVEQCVCATDPRCCNDSWPDFCVALVNGGCGVCKGDCCAEHGGGGCADPTIEACVCGKDVTGDCCKPNGPWDFFCVSLVESLAGGPACGQCPN